MPIKTPEQKQLESSVTKYLLALRFRHGTISHTTDPSDRLARRLLNLKADEYSLALDNLKPPEQSLESAGFDTTIIRIIDHEKYYDWLRRWKTS